MADRHNIVVHIKGGEVLDVQFCECLHGVTLGVRTYIENARQVSSLGDPNASDEYQLDQFGRYGSTFYEPEDVE